MRTIAVLLFFLLVGLGFGEAALGQSPPTDSYQQRMTGALSTAKQSADEFPERV